MEVTLGPFWRGKADDYWFSLVSRKVWFLFCNVILKCIPLKRTGSTFIKQKLTDSTPSLFKYWSSTSQGVILFNSSIQTCQACTIIVWFISLRIWLAQYFVKECFVLRKHTHTHTHTHTHINALNWWSNSSLLLIKLNWLIIKRTFETKKLIEKPFFSSF